jgi:hypothetical protein
MCRKQAVLGVYRGVLENVLHRSKIKLTPTYQKKAMASFRSAPLKTSTGSDQPLRAQRGCRTATTSDIDDKETIWHKIEWERIFGG